MSDATVQRHRVLAALHLLQSRIELSLAGDRSLTERDEDLIDRLLAWYRTWETERGGQPARLNTDCAGCGTPDDACWVRITEGKTACCSACQYRATHNQNAPGYVPPWSDD